MSLIVIVVTAFILTRATAGIGYRLHLIDRPDARKRHVGDVPLTGGWAILLTFLLSSYLLDIPPFSTVALILTCAMFAAGLFGDIKHLRASTRLLLHYGVGILLAVYGGVSIVNVGNLLALGDIPLLMLSVPLTALSVAGLCNAYNMIDGIDGLAASTAAQPLLTLLLLAIAAQHPMAWSLLPVLVPVCVFLAFNLGPANRLMPRIFLGDAGSVTLGFFVTASLVYFSQGPDAIIKPVTALWLVALPLMDMLSTMLRRIRKGRPVMTADRSHIHHILIGLGLGSRATLALLVCWSVLCAGVGLALESAPASISLAVYFLFFCGHCLFALNASRIARSLHAGSANLPENAQS